MEIAGWLGVAGLILYFLAVSWRRWPDPQIDFGTQLYIPWRLIHGAVLYRDVDQYYGPFSQYFNAALFKLFGPSLMVLVSANLIIFTCIVVTLGKLLRRAWGAFAAIVAVGIFVTIFGFSQYVGIGNYNYATPYVHESTHGFLICLLLVATLIHWLEKPTLLKTSLAGTLLGLTAVLKPEFMLSGGLITIASITLFFLSNRHLPRWTIIFGASGVILPTLLFALWFSCYLPVKESLLAASGAWSIMVTSPDIANNPVQSQFLGFDHFWPNFKEHFLATGYALLTFALLAGIARKARDVNLSALRHATCAIVVISFAWLSWTQIHWLQIGRCLLGLIFIYALAKIFVMMRTRERGLQGFGENVRLLLAILAVSLMARMALNGRIFHFGFYQAALAAILIPSILLGELSGWLRLKSRDVIIITGTLSLIIPGVILLALQSQRNFALKTQPVGTGSDMFYTFAPQITPKGKILALTSEFLGAQSTDQTALVLPEGLMINYLSRKVSPLAPLLFYTLATSNGREALLVKKLEQRPPNWVILISRDLREGGIQRYGEISGSGKELLDWVTKNYKVARAAGGDPLDPRQQGVIIYQRK